MSELLENVNHSYYVLDKKISELLTNSLESDDLKVINKIIEEIDSVQCAYFLLISTYVNRVKLISLLNDKMLSEVLTNVIPNIRSEIIDVLGIKKISQIIAQLAPDEIILIIGELSKKEQVHILKKLPKKIKSFASELLSYPKGSAGRLIRKDIIIIPEHWNVDNVIIFIKNHRKTSRRFYEVFVVNSQLKPVGSIALDVMIYANKDDLVREIMNTNIKVIQPGTDQEEVAQIFHKCSLLSAPVINRYGRIIGSIVIDDVVNVIHSEAEEDIFHFGMVSNSDSTSSLSNTLYKRFPWLIINLFTATLSSMIIGIFSHTLQSFVDLAVVMPVIASMSGNTGLQALTVTVRAIATKQLAHGNFYRLLIKESLIGFINGTLLALISSVVIMIRFHNIKIEILFSISMIITFTASTLLGAAVPILLDFFKIDPAVSSSIIICAASDALSFLIFLGLATIFLV